MANHPSAAKRNRQRIQRTARNKSVTTALKTALKKARGAITAGNKAVAKDLVHAATKSLARAAIKGSIHARSASRTTARLSAALFKLGS